MAEIKWSCSEIIAFLNIYQKFECLWDASSPNYLKRDERNVAFNDLVAKLNATGIYITVEALKKKIKSIRDTYRNELNRGKKSKKSGAGTQEIYTPKLAWFSTADSFLRKIRHGRESSSNLDINDSMESPSSRDEKEDDESFETINETSSQGAETQCSNYLQGSPYEESGANRQKMPPPQPSPKVFKPGKAKAPSSGFQSAVNKLHDIAQITTSDPEDQYDKFGKHIAAQLRELPLRSFINLQEKIQSLITAERLYCLDSLNPTQVYPQPSPLVQNCDFQEEAEEVALQRALLSIGEKINR